MAGDKNTVAALSRWTQVWKPWWTGRGNSVNFSITPAKIHSDSGKYESPIILFLFATTCAILQLEQKRWIPQQSEEEVMTQEGAISQRAVREAADSWRFTCFSYLQPDSQKHPPPPPRVIQVILTKPSVDTNDVHRKSYCWTVKAALLNITRLIRTIITQISAWISNILSYCEIWRDLLGLAQRMCQKHDSP